MINCYLQSDETPPLIFLPVKEHNQECIFDYCIRRLLAGDNEVENEMVLRCNFYRWPELAFLALEPSMRYPHGKQVHRCFSHIPHTPLEQPLPQYLTRAALDLLNFDLRPLILHTHYG